MLGKGLEPAGDEQWQEDDLQTYLTVQHDCHEMKWPTKGERIQLVQDYRLLLTIVDQHLVENELQQFDFSQCCWKHLLPRVSKTLHFLETTKRVMMQKRERSKTIVLRTMCRPLPSLVDERMVLSMQRFRCVISVLNCHNRRRRCGSSRLERNSHPSRQICNPVIAHYWRPPLALDTTTDRRWIEQHKNHRRQHSVMVW